MPIVGEGTAHRTAIAAHDLGFRVRALFQLAFNGAHPADSLFQLLLGVAVGLKDGLGGFAEVVKVAQLVGDIWQGFFDGTAERGLAIGDDTHNGHTQCLPYSVNEVRQIVLRKRAVWPSPSTSLGSMLSPESDHCAMPTTVVSQRFIRS